MIFRLFFICFLLSSVSISHSSEDPWSIINKAAKATKTLDYKGIFHSQHHKQIKSIEFILPWIKNFFQIFTYSDNRLIIRQGAMPKIVCRRHLSIGIDKPLRQLW